MLAAPKNSTQQIFLAKYLYLLFIIAAMFIHIFVVDSILWKKVRPTSRHGLNAINSIERPRFIKCRTWLAKIPHFHCLHTNLCSRLSDEFSNASSNLSDSAGNIVRLVLRHLSTYRSEYPFDANELWYNRIAAFFSNPIFNCIPFARERMNNHTLTRPFFLSPNTLYNECGAYSFSILSRKNFHFAFSISMHTFCLLHLLNNDVYR